MQDNADDALKARLVRAFYDLAEQETRQANGTGPAPDAQTLLDTRAELERVVQALRVGSQCDGPALIQALETAEAYLLKATDTPAPKTD